MPSGAPPAARTVEHLDRRAPRAPGAPVFVDVTARRLRRSRRAAAALIAGCLAYVAMVGTTVLTDPVEPATSPAEPEGLPAAVVTTDEGEAPAGLVDPDER